MHYYIDGYNLLFSLFGPVMSDFTSRRDWLIQTLNAKVELLGLEISLVFDSHFCEGNGSRSHFHHLEILYTSKGVSADDFIIKKIKQSVDPTKTVLVSNDRELTFRARNLLANTQTLDEFINWLDKRYKNKAQRKSRPISPFKLRVQEIQKQIENLPKPTPPSPSEPIKPRLMLIPEQNTPEDHNLFSEETHIAPAEMPGTLEYYLAHFERADEQFLIELEAAKIKRKEEKKRKKRNR